MSEQQDGIEGRALEFYFEEVETRINGVDEDVVTLITNFARTEIATLTAENNRLREALRELLESAKHAQMETHETFTSNTLFDAVVKAEKIFDTDADR